MRIGIMLTVCVGTMASVASATVPPARWEMSTPVPVSERLAAEAAAFDGKVYVVGGRPTIGEQQHAPVHVLDPRTGSWSEAAPLDGPREWPALLITNSSELRVLAGHRWTIGEPYFWPVMTGRVYLPDLGERGAMPDRQYITAYYSTATDDRGRLYLIGGRDLLSGYPSDVVERYDPATNQWETLANMPRARASGAAVFDGRGNIMYVGGEDEWRYPIGTVYRYNIQTNTWTTLPSRPVKLNYMRGALGLDGRLYFLSGWNPTNWFGTTTTWIFDPQTNTWSDGPALSVRRSAPAVSVDDRGYLWAVGGYAETYGTNAVERLDTACPSDFDRNGFTDADDFVGYYAAYLAGDESTDVDRSGFVDADDFVAYLGVYARGCR
jgi:hypothetical protein